VALLHIVNRSPFEHSALPSCLRLAKRGSGILLIEDATLAASAAGEWAERLSAAMVEHPLYVLLSDFRARGFGEAQLIAGATAVDDAGFVALVCEYDASLSWR